MLTVQRHIADYEFTGLAVERALGVSYPEQCDIVLAPCRGLVLSLAALSLAESLALSLA